MVPGNGVGVGVGAGANVGVSDGVGVGMGVRVDVGVPKTDPHLPIGSAGLVRLLVTRLGLEPRTY